MKLPRWRSLRRWLTALSLAATVSAAGQSENELLPLPTWSESEEPSPLLGGLLPQAPQVYQPGLAPAPPSGEGIRLTDGPPQLFPEGFEGLQVGDMGLFLPESLLATGSDATPPMRPPTPAIAIEDLPLTAFDAACARSTTTFLLDPLGLIPEMPRASLERFLEFHAKDSRVPIIVLAMDRHHRLLEGVQLDRLASGQGSTAERAVVAYPIGEPWRARVFLSRSLHEAATRSYLTGMASDCINDALQVSDPHDQLHRFCVRLSTRLFWLEDVMPPAQSGVASKGALHEIESEASAASPALGLSFLELGRQWGWAVLAMALMAPLLWLASRRLSARRQAVARSTIWILPEPDIDPRLGGAFCGGTSATASFRSKAG